MNPLMTHIVAGYPTIATSKRLLNYMVSQNVAAIELQIPFSDPAADGTILMHANEAAAKQGTGRNEVLGLIDSVDFKQTKCLIMCYYQSLFYQAPAQYIQQAISKGCQGFIVPDLPFDAPDIDELLAQVPSLRTQFIPVLSPGISQARLALLAQKFQPEIIYLTARKGITGAKTSFSSSFTTTCRQVRATFPNAQLAVGFGITSKGDVKKVLAHADIAVVGSALTTALNTSENDFYKKVQSLL